MPRTTPLTTTMARALAGRGKAAAAAVAAAAVLGGAGTASAATIAGASSAPHEAAHHVAPHAKTAAHAAQVATRHAEVVTDVRNSSPSKSAVPAKSAPAPAKAAPAPAPAKAAPAPAKPAAPAPPPAPARPYQVYDSVTPSAIPAGARVATYATGGYAVSPASVAARSHVTWIDTNASDPRAAALDVEPGDATPAQAAAWTWHKLHAAAGDTAIIYTMRSEWPATQQAIATLPQPMQHQVRYWIADPTGVPHIVPGASATQWYWGQNFDISTAAPGSGL